jgi:hypothetical protein
MGAMRAVAAVSDYYIPPEREFKRIPRKPDSSLSRAAAWAIRLDAASSGMNKPGQGRNPERAQGAPLANRDATN